MPDKAKKGDWVQIHETVLEPKERAPHLPDDTREVPLELWVKGFINIDASIGDNVDITTVTGRVVSGCLVEINPGYSHNFGECAPELLHIGPQLKKILKDGPDYKSCSPQEVSSEKSCLRGC